jgi:hypothetical protein
MHGSQALVEEMLDSRVRLAEIESYIEDIIGIAEDDRSALWLLAWVETSQRNGREPVCGRFAGDLPWGLGGQWGPEATGGGVSSLPLPSWLFRRRRGAPGGPVVLYG